MGLFGWLTRAPRNGPRARIEQWRRQWAAAAAEPSTEQIQALTCELEALGLDEEEIEMEREMLDALERVRALASAAAGDGLPVIETGHRIAGSDRCHFSATASMPDEPGQPAGRLLLTSTRAAFAAGGASRTVPWHAVMEAAHQDRDLLLIRADRETAYRFRCNTYGDALCAAFVARRLLRPRAARI